MAAGARNKEIAAALSISENTVRWHVANLHQKLDVTTRTEAVHVARERGLLSAGLAGPSLWMGEGLEGLRAKLPALSRCDRLREPPMLPSSAHMEGQKR